MLHEVLQVVDANRDGRIDYQGKISSASFSHPPRLIMPCVAEFRNFVHYAEDKLWPLFRYVDRNQTGKIDRDTLREAFARSGVTVSEARIDEFFNDVDKNKDGVITYAEWRYVISHCLGG